MPATTKYFTVTVPQGLSTIKLDSKGCATCQLTVKNVSRAAIDGRAVLVSLPITRPPAGVVEKNWVKIDGPADRHFAVDQEEVFSVKIAVPQKKGEPAPAGSYSFRLDVVNIARPDESSDQSQALGFTVAAAPPPKPSPWPLIAVVAALVLLVGGVTVWLLLRTKSATTADAKPTPTPVPVSTPIPTPTAVPISTPVPAPTPPPPIATPMTGTWLNDKAGPEDVSKLVIEQACMHQAGCRFNIQLYRKCGTSDCALVNVQGVSQTNNAVQVRWAAGPMQSDMLLELSSLGDLRCTLDMSVMGRGRRSIDHLRRIS